MVKRKRTKKSSRYSRKSRKYSRKSRRFSRRKRRTSRRTRGATSLNTYNLANLRPDKLKVRLKYAYLTNSNAITGGVTTPWQFSGNSPWDPQYIGTGTSANMWANLSSWYAKYMCTYSKIWIKVTVQDVGGMQVQAWFQPRTLIQIPATDIRTILAQPYGHFKQLQGSSQTKTGSITFYGKMSTPKMLGRKMDPSLDRIGVSSDPTEEWIWDLNVLASTSISVNVEARMEYWVEFSDRYSVSYL